MHANMSCHSYQKVETASLLAIATRNKHVMNNASKAENRPVSEIQTVSAMLLKESIPVARDE